MRPIDVVTLLTGGGAILLIGFAFLARDRPNSNQEWPRIVKAAVRLVILGGVLAVLGQISR